MIGKKILFAIIGLSAFSLLAATRKDPTDVPVSTVDELITAISGGVAGDRILIAPGTYDLTGQQMATTGTSAMKGHLSVTKVYSFLGQGANPEDTVLKADGDSHRVMMINTSAGTVVSNLTFTNGKCTDLGGAVLVYAGATEFVDCRFLKCRGSSGGAIHVKSDGTGTVARNCWFEENYSGAGGGVNNCNTEDCVFTNNLVQGTGGGAYLGTHLRSKFYFNGAIGNTTAGGGAVGDARYGHTLVCVSCDFVGNTNTVANSHGSAVYYGGAFTNCFFTANEGVDGVLQGVTELYGCTFTSNNSSSVCRWCDTISNSRFINERNYVAVNSVKNDHPFTLVKNTLIQGQSGTGYATNSEGSFHFLNCTFVDNNCSTAPLNDYATAVNCVFSGNLPRDIYGSLYPTMTNCLYGTRSGTAELTKAVNCKQIADVKFKDPANGDYSPKGIRSPLYNAGYEDDGYLATVGATDCAGGERVRFDHIDIGAFELQKRPGLQMIIR